MCVCLSVCFTVEQIFTNSGFHSQMINSKREETNQTWLIFTLPSCFDVYDKQKNTNVYTDFVCTYFRNLLHEY
jgi:hypothetical protein